MTDLTRSDRLPDHPTLPERSRHRLETDFERFATLGMPADLPSHLAETYQVDLTGRYAGRSIRCPFGKGSGQLSMRLSQVLEAIEARLGFVVLKTVIAESPTGTRTMGEWAIDAPKMVVEPIQGKRSGQWGWTVTWAGRGWSESFANYLRLVEESRQAAKDSCTLIAPSVKYHLPSSTDEPWRIEEYDHSTACILDAVLRTAPGTEIAVIEKDFSPTLAGSNLASTRATILNWLTMVPGLMRGGAGGRPCSIGLKLFNAVDKDEFQIAMLESVHQQADRPDFLVYANRLFDPSRSFEGKQGVAYGGPDLSDRNLDVLSAFLERGNYDRLLEMSATGDISSGRIAMEYALRGCSSFQIHTGFQLPHDAYPMKIGSRVQRSLHRFLFDPRDGLIAWLLHVGAKQGLSDGGMTRLLDVARVVNPG